MILGHLDLWLSVAHGPGFGRNKTNQIRLKLNDLGFSDAFWPELRKAWVGLWKHREHLANSDDVRFRLALLEQLEILAFSARDLEKAYVEL